MSKTAKSSTPPSRTRRGQAHDITVSVTDSDGDVVSQTVHLETVGMQVGGVHSDTRTTGGSGADIIIGDKGHIDGVQNTGIYNLSLVLDVSNSMYAMLDNGNTRLASSVEALNNLIDSIAARDGSGRDNRQYPAGRDSIPVHSKTAGSP